MILTITKQHIRNAQLAQMSGTYDTCSQCVVAQAIRDIPGWENAHVNYDSAWVPDANYNTIRSVEITPEVKQFILDFDARMPVRPGTFHL